MTTQTKSCESCKYWHERVKEDKRKRCTSPNGLCKTHELENWSEKVKPKWIALCNGGPNGDVVGCQANGVGKAIGSLESMMKALGANMGQVIRNDHPAFKDFEQTNIEVWEADE